jgi:RNA polymerase sigma-70 factor (ECF subfamily)
LRHLRAHRAKVGTGGYPAPRFYAIDSEIDQSRIRRDDAIGANYTILLATSDNLSRKQKQWTDGNEHAWDVFLARFRASLYETAYRIAKDEATGRELADGLYAELYGIPNREGRRISKLDYYMGRGSLEGWLRTVLARKHIDRCRTQAKDVSLEKQIEAGVGFAASPPVEIAEADDRVSTAVAQTLAEVCSEERFLLASYFLDQRTLANIGRQLGVHESTISRKLEKLTGKLRKRLRKRLQTAGINPQRCEELLLEIDVRDLNVNVAENLRQESPVESF